MTTVHIDLRQPNGEEVTGSLEWTPTRRRHVDGPGPAPDPGDYIVLPGKVVVDLTRTRVTDDEGVEVWAGVADVDLEPDDGVTWAWRVRERTSPRGLSRYVHVPDADVVDYGDLVVLDRDTLEPSAEPEAAWWAALADAVATIPDGADITAAVAAYLVAHPPQTDAVVVRESAGDDTARINAAIAQADADGLSRVALVGSFETSAPIVLRSGITLDATAATITTAGTTHPFVTNAAAGTTGRDTDVAVLGGRWVAGPTDGPTHRFHLHRVDGVRIVGPRIESTSGKYAILLADVTRAHVTGPSFQVASDGVHVTGPARDVVIENVTGRTGDDFVALGCSDYLAYDYSRGDIEDVVVRNLRPDNESTGRAVLLFLWGDASITNELHMRHVHIDDVRGKVGQHGVYVTAADALNPAASFEDIVVENVSVRPGSGYGQVTWNAAVPVLAPVVRGVTVPENRVGPSAPPAVWVSRPLDRLTVEGIRSALPAASTLQSRLVHVQANVGDLLVSDVNVRQPNGGAVVNISGGTVERLIESNVLHSGQGSNVIVDTSGGLGTALLSNVRLTGSTATNMVLRNRSATTPVVVVAGVIVDGSSRLVNLEGSGGATILGAGFHRVGSALAYGRTASQPLRVRLLDFPADVTHLTPVAGDQVTNTNASAAGGVGPVVYDGTTWRPFAQPGAPGAAGAPGKSAYQVAVDAGFVGDVAAWLASLVGEPGDPGDPGPATEWRATSTHLQARPVGGSTWTDVVPLSAITGPPGGPGTTSWDGLTDMPAVVAAGDTLAEARAALGIYVVAPGDPVGTDPNGIYLTRVPA